ncbi:MAG: hypothetical protein Q8Q31_00495 [Nanoarchaeota archaeon]|nr:hypothetical protein [Nanoarchaeota archaeon]
MQRKLIGQGLGGITVHLPKRWIDAHHLKKGNEIDIEDSEGKLIISPKKINKDKKETSIRLSGLEESLIRTLIANTYRLGYDSIKVDFENEKQFQILNEIIQKRLIGFEIIKKDSGSCIVENVTEPEEDQFGNIMQKLFLNIDTLLENINQLCSSDKAQISESIDELDDRILKYDNFCRRILLRRRFDEKSALHLAFLTMIIHGERELYYLSKSIGKGMKCSSETLKIIGGIAQINKLIQEAYNKKKFDNLADINAIGRRIIYKEGYKLMENKKGKELIVIHHLLACTRDFYQAVSPLSGLLFT